MKHKVFEEKADERSESHPQCHDCVEDLRYIGWFVGKSDDDY